MSTENGQASASEGRIRAALDEHWRASVAADADAEHAIYAGDAIRDHPQSGDRILGRRNLQALRSEPPPWRSQWVQRMP